MIMNKSASKKTLIASAAAVSLSALLFAGTTYAWFTDSASSATSTIQSGNLDVNLYQLQKTGTTTNENSETVDTYDYVAVTSNNAVFDSKSDWEPGAVQVVYLKVANDGSLALKYNLSLPIFENTKAVSVTNEEIDLSKVLKASVVKLDEGKMFDSRSEALAAAKTGTAVSLGTDSALAGNLTAKSGDTFAVVVYMPEETGNEANHTAAGAPSIKVGVHVSAAQDTVENDSYGKDYDSNAEIPAYIPVSSAADLKEAAAAAKDGDVIELSSDIELTEPLTFTKAVTIKGDGDTTISGKAITATADLTVEDVNFAKATNTSNNASSVYAYTGATTITFEGCTFSNPQWEMIQITSGDFEELIINNCTFVADDVNTLQTGYGNNSDQLIRFIHIQPSTNFYNKKITITNNTFKNCDKTTTIAGLYYIKGEITIGGNTFEDVDKSTFPVTELLQVGWPINEELSDFEKWTGEIATYTFK
jgi:predicted ribosomally synthesized peptide with SipW-like signal peptide